MPIVILAVVLLEVCSLLLLLIDYKLWREWQEFRHTSAHEYASRCLYGAIILMAYLAFGRYLVILLVSKSKRKEAGPAIFTAVKPTMLKRPDGSRLYIEEYGNPFGQPIIFVHGWNADRTEWYYQRKYFEKEYRLIMFDLPGTGRSRRPNNKDFSISKMAKDLHAVIEYTNAKNPILWGHSIGGMTILTLASKARDILDVNIKALILQHTTYTNPIKTSIFNKLLTRIQKPVLQPLCYLIIAFSPLVWLVRWLSFFNGNAHLMMRLLTFTGTQTPKQLNYITLLSIKTPPSVTARGLLGMMKYDLTEELSQIDIPSLIIAADADRLTKPLASAFMQQEIRGAQMVVLSPAGHHALIERNKETNQAALAFLESIK